MGNNSSNYSGVERRVMQRRVQKDRRVLIRFEPGKKVRRKTNDRRKGEAGDQ